MPLTECLNKIALNKPDREAINSIASELVQDGMTPEEALAAENSAVDQHLSTVNSDLDNIASRAKEMGAEVAVVEEPQVLDQEAARVTELGLYSAVEKTVLDMNIPGFKPSKKNPEGKANGRDIWAKIKSSPIKKEEVDWLGIEDFLTADPKAKFKREDVVDYVRQNGINVEEVVAEEGEGAEGTELEWDSGVVWDDPEAWEHIVEDTLSEFDQGEEWAVNINADEWMNGWVNDNQEEVVNNYIGSLPPDQQDDLNAMEDANDQVNYLHELDLEINQDMRSQARDDFEEYANEHAEASYMDDPVYIYTAENEGVDLFIFGNDEFGYDIREDSWELQTNTVGLDVSYSIGEAQIQAQNYAMENDMLRDEEDPEVTKWSEYVADGYAENYREIKLTLPDIEGDFYNEVHFPDRNIVAFLRVDDRELKSEPPPDVGEVRIEKTDVGWMIVDVETGLNAGLGAAKFSTEEDAQKAIDNNEYEPLIKELAEEKNTYFIEELQSDWHQGGRQQGYSTGEIDAGELENEGRSRFNKLVIDIVGEEAFSNPSSIGVSNTTQVLNTIVRQVLYANGKMPEVMVGIEDGRITPYENVIMLIEKSGRIDEFESRLDKVIQLEKQVKAEMHGVPDAPFKGDAWLNLSLKRAVVDAVNNGYEAIAWANAEILVDRWSDRYRTLYETQYNKKMPSLIRKMTKETPEHLNMDGDKVSHQELGYWVVPITDKLKKSVAEVGFPLFQEDREKDRRGTIQLFPESAIIKLHQASDLSSFLHESAHLFLAMEGRLSEGLELTKDQQTILDFLEVKSFAEIGKEQQEKFAETFEVYLREGKAPSLALKDAFAAFKEWLLRIYQTLKDPRLARAELTPDITEVFDRMLATEAEIEQAMANPAYDQFFKSKEQAGMTDQEWEEYQARVEKAKNRSQESLDAKVLKELYRRKTKEWKEEKQPIIEKETERLSEEPVYLIRESLKKFPMDRDATKEAMGIPPTLTAAERIEAGKTIKPTDSLLVAAARSGGLNMEIWAREGVDPEYLKDRAFNNQVFGHPVFRKDKGLTPDALTEIANQYGYGQDLSANDTLELVFKELDGDLVYTPEGYAVATEAEYQERFGEVSPEKKTPFERFLNRSTIKGGVDPQNYTDFHGYPDSKIMITAQLEAPPIKQAARDSAENIMIGKYGDILNDGSIDEEIRESIHTNAQAELLLSELRALKPKATRIDTSYLKAQAKKLISTMKYNEIKPSKYYRAEIKAAKKAVEDPDNAYQYKVQQLANHYMYKEAVIVRDQMIKQRRYVRKLQTQQYPANTVDPMYAQNIRMLARAYNMKQGAARRENDTENIVTWMITQIEDENNFINFDIYDPALIQMIQARQMGLPVDYTLPEFADLTAAELKGLYNQLRHMRFVGGKSSVSQKKEMDVSRGTAALSIRKQARKQIPATHDVSLSERRKDTFLELGYSHRRIGGIFETLDGFEEGLPMADENERIAKASDKALDLTNDIAKAMDEAFKGVLKLINRRKTTTIIKDDGMEFTLNHRARFVLGLNWGNEGNKKAVLDGLNNKFLTQFTERDIVRMLSTMSNAELEALNKVWAAKEPLWPEMSGVEVRLKGVAPPKVEAVPFEINDVKLTGGHYRLHYRPDPNDSARSELATDKPGGDKIKLYTASSLNQRVGSGGRQVDLDLSHLFSDIQEEIHYIANAELATHLNAMFKGVNNPVVETIINGYGNVYYKNLIHTLSAITQKEDPAKGLWKFLKIVRTNLTYAYLAWSARNVLQQPIAITNAISQLGEKYMLKGTFEFYRNPVANWEKIRKSSPFMRNRTALVNREAREQLMQMDSVHPAFGKMKNTAFAPQTYMDSLIAFPTWMGALSKYKAEHPAASEAKAKRYADEMVAKTIGSGLTKDIGSILSKGEAEKQITFMGTFFNLTWNLHVENAQLLKRGKISGMEYARRLGWMAIAPALIQMWILDDIPEDDEEVLEHSLKEIAFYNMSSLFLVRDLASGIDGFTPSIPGLKWIEGVIRVEKGMRDVMTGDEELDAEQLARIVRGLQPLLPLVGSGQVARTLEGIADPEQELYGALVEGKERNK